MEATHVLAFVDEANLVSLCQERKRKPDWNKLRGWLAKPNDHRQLIEMVIYVGTAPIIPDAQHFRRYGRTWRAESFYEYDNFMVFVKDGMVRDLAP